MYRYEYYYFELLDMFKMLKRYHLYNIPKVKGSIYKYYTKKANSSFRELTVNEMSDINPNLNSKVIVSLTTYGERTKLVYITIDTIMRQTVKPYKVILWLSEEEYPNGEEDLPDALLIRLNNCPIFEIRFCEDLKPHKKYYEAMTQYPDYTIVTADDDVFYPSNWLETLILLHMKYPDCICCSVAHEITIDEDGEIMKYSEWNHQVDKVGPSMRLCPVGVGGVLYPPASLNIDYCKKDIIKKTCLYADDLWLKTMSLLNHTPVVRTSMFGYGFLTVNGVEKSALSLSNVKENKNDTQLQSIMCIYGKYVREVFKNDNNSNISNS